MSKQFSDYTEEQIKEVILKVRSPRKALDELDIEYSQENAAKILGYRNK